MGVLFVLGVVYLYIFMYAHAHRHTHIYTFIYNCFLSLFHSFKKIVEIEFHHLVPAGLELHTIILSQPPEYWEYRFIVLWSA